MRAIGQSDDHIFQLIPRRIQQEVEQELKAKWSELVGQHQQLYQHSRRGSFPGENPYLTPIEEALTYKFVTLTEYNHLQDTIVLFLGHPSFLFRIGIHAFETSYQGTEAAEKELLQQKGRIATDPFVVFAQSTLGLRMWVENKEAVTWRADMEIAGERYRFPARMYLGYRFAQGPNGVYRTMAEDYRSLLFYIPGISERIVQIWPTMPDGWKRRFLSWFFPINKPKSARVTVVPMALEALIEAEMNAFNRLWQIETRVRNGVFEIKTNVAANTAENGQWIRYGRVISLRPGRALGETSMDFLDKNGRDHAQEERARIRYVGGTDMDGNKPIAYEEGETMCGPSGILLERHILTPVIRRGQLIGSLLPIAWAGQTFAPTAPEMVYIVDPQPHPLWTPLRQKVTRHILNQKRGVFKQLIGAQAKTAELGARTSRNLTEREVELDAKMQAYPTTVLGEKLIAGTRVRLQTMAFAWQADLVGYTAATQRASNNGYDELTQFTGRVTRWREQTVASVRANGGDIIYCQGDKIVAVFTFDWAGFGESFAHMQGWTLARLGQEAIRSAIDCITMARPAGIGVRIGGHYGDVVWESRVDKPTDPPDANGGAINIAAHIEEFALKNLLKERGDELNYPASLLGISDAFLSVCLADAHPTIPIRTMFEEPIESSLKGGRVEQVHIVQDRFLIPQTDPNSQEIRLDKRKASMTSVRREIINPLGKEFILVIPGLDDKPDEYAQPLAITGQDKQKND